MNRSDVDIALADVHSLRAAATSKPGIYKRANVFVLAASIAPELVQLRERGAGHLERSPDPVRRGLQLFHLDLAYGAANISYDRIEVFGTIDREQQKREYAVL